MDTARKQELQKYFIHKYETLDSCNEEFKKNKGKPILDML